MNYLERVGGIPVRELVSEWGTPTYVYDAGVIRRQIESLRSFDTIRYAQKANCNLSILRIVRELGAVVDAVSAGEIQRALETGFIPSSDPPGIVYTADIFDEPSLKQVLEHQIHVNMGSMDMLQPYAKVATRRDITIRVNPGFGHGHGPKVNTGGPWSKHGIWHEQLDDCVRLAEELELRIIGLHVHIGSGADMQHLMEVAIAATRLAHRCSRHLTTLSCGGGLPVPYRESDTNVDISHYFQCWDAARGKLERELQRKIRLEVEPGRFITAQSGWLICRILGTKEIEGRLFYLTDAGFNDLVRPAFYGAYHPIQIARREPALQNAIHMSDVVIAGPLCESGDVFTQGEGGIVETRRLPAASQGDFVVIGCAGAYGFAMASNYNSKPFAAEVLVDAGVPRLIRRRQTLHELYALETNLG